jgi:hypothetical protein
MVTGRQLPGSQWSRCTVHSDAASNGDALAVIEHLLGAAEGGLAGVLGVNKVCPVQALEPLTQAPWLRHAAHTPAVNSKGARRVPKPAVV